MVHLSSISLLFRLVDGWVGRWIDGSDEIKLYLKFKLRLSWAEIKTSLFLTQNYIFFSIARCFRFSTYCLVMNVCVDLFLLSVLNIRGDPSAVRDWEDNFHPVNSLTVCRVTSQGTGTGGFKYFPSIFHNTTNNKINLPYLTISIWMSDLPLLGW